MAIINNKLSKSYVTPKTAILFVHTGHSSTSGRTDRHAHPFWQLEIGIQGTIGVWNAGEEEHLRPTHALLLPPGREHAFIYPAHEVRWATYKFELGLQADNQTSYRVGDGHLLSPLIPVLAELASEVDRGTPLETATAASLLEAVCSYLGGIAGPSASHPLPARSRFVTRIDELLAEAGIAYTGVGDLAAALNRSPGHLSNRFRQETGRSLKSHIDEVRFSYIRKLLTHADMPIKLIAHQAGFPDMYAFSRFVKRVSGASPRTYRRE